MTAKAALCVSSMFMYMVRREKTPLALLYLFLCLRFCSSLVVECRWCPDDLNPSHVGSRKLISLSGGTEVENRVVAEAFDSVLPFEIESLERSGTVGQLRR